MWYFIESIANSTFTKSHETSVKLSRLRDLWYVELKEDESIFIIDTLDIHNTEHARKYTQKYTC